MSEIDYCSNCVLGSFGSVPGMKLAVETVRLRRGDLLYRKGDVPTHVYCLRWGIVAEYREDAAETEVVGLALAGEAAGLKDIESPKYEGSAVALARTEACAIPIIEIRRHLTGNQTLHQCMIRAFGWQIGRQQTLIQIRHGRTGGAGLALLLTTIASRKPPGQDETEPSLRISRQLLADYLGTSVSTVDRQLRQLARSGLISIAGDRIDLLDVAGLEKLSGDARQPEHTP